MTAPSPPLEAARSWPQRAACMLAYRTAARYVTELPMGRVGSNASALPDGPRPMRISMIVRAKTG